MNNPISPLLNVYLKLNNITVLKEADQVIFFKYSGEISRQIILTDINNRKNEEIKKEIRISDS